MVPAGGQRSTVHRALEIVVVLRSEPSEQSLDHNLVLCGPAVTPCSLHPFGKGHTLRSVFLETQRAIMVKYMQRWAWRPDRDMKWVISGWTT